jgi:hypothetical protein
VGVALVGGRVSAQEVHVLVTLLFQDRKRHEG